LASVITVEAIGVPSIVKYTAVLARPVPLSASFEVMLSLDDVPALKVSFAVICGAVVLGGRLTGRLVALTVELEVVGAIAPNDVTARSVEGTTDSAIRI